MTAHPYPDHVRDAVAAALNGEWNPAYEPILTALFRDYAETALTALWEASRVDTIEQLDAIPDFSSLVDDDGFTYRAYELRNPNVFPVHVVHWGDEL